MLREHGAVENLDITQPEDSAFANASISPNQSPTDIPPSSSRASSPPALNASATSDLTLLPDALLSAQAYTALSSLDRRLYLSTLLALSSRTDLEFIAHAVSQLMKRDLLLKLPPELALHILSFIDEPGTLLRVGALSKYWYTLVQEECIWKRLCDIHQFSTEADVMTCRMSPQSVI